MKKLIVLFALILIATGLYAQSATVLKYKPSAVTVYGTGTGETIFPIVSGEYDCSIQMIPALSGSGDSVDFSHVAYLSDSYSDNVWTSVSSADTVSSTTDSDAIIYWTDLKPVRIKVIYTGLSTDTITIQPYAVYKRHAHEAGYAEPTGSTVLLQKMSAVVVPSSSTGTTTFPTIQGEYDVSLQMIPSAYGAGQSLTYSYIIYQSNHDSDNAWTAITSSATVSSATDADALVAITDFKGLRLKAIYTNASETDSVTVTPYSVYKKHYDE